MRSCGVKQKDAVSGVRIINAAEHPVLSNRLSYCSLQHFLTETVAQRSLDDCAVIDLDGSLGIVWQSTVGFKDQFAFFRQLRPVKLIRDHVTTKMTAVDQIKPSFGVHHRNTVIEYFPQGKRDKPEEVAVILEKCKNDIVKEEIKSKWLNLSTSLGREEAAYMCTLKPDEIEKMLAVRGIQIKLMKGSSKKWFLLDDYSLCDAKGSCPHMQDELFDVGATLMCPTSHWAMGWVCHTLEPFKSAVDLANTNYTAYANYLAPIIDQWMGVQVCHSFYFGVFLLFLSVARSSVAQFHRSMRPSPCCRWIFTLG